MIWQLINKITSAFRKILLGKRDSQKSRPELIDFRTSNTNISPLDVLLFSSVSESKYVLEVPVEKIINSQLLYIWIKTLMFRMQENNRLITKKRQSYLYLKDYFRIFQPKNVAEYLGLDLEVENSDYLLSSPLEAVMPWSNDLPKDRKEFVKRFTKNEFERYHKSPYQTTDGYKFFGPSSNRFIEVEYKRLIKPFESIKQIGYNEKLGFIDARLIFVKGEEYMIEQGDGSHRTAVLVALNHTTIPMVFSNKKTRIVRREDVTKWPNVQSGLYSQEQALKLFDEKFISLKQRIINDHS